MNFLRDDGGIKIKLSDPIIKKNQISVLIYASQFMFFTHQKIGF